MNNWLNTFGWKRRLDIMRVRMIPLKFMWLRKVLFLTRKTLSISFKVTMILEKEKKDDPKIAG